MFPPGCVARISGCIISTLHNCEALFKTVLMIHPLPAAREYEHLLIDAGPGNHENSVYLPIHTTAI